MAWGDLSKFINPATFVREGWTHENTDLGMGSESQLCESYADEKRAEIVLKKLTKDDDACGLTAGEELRCGWWATPG